MKIVIACDKFKHSLTSKEANRAIGRGLFKVLSGLELSCVELADGGEGSLDVFRNEMGAGTVQLYVNDPLGREVRAEYLFLNGVAFIEMSKASGLSLLRKEEYNPLITSTYGLGQMIKDAVERDADHIIIGIGGSATNDGGIGMLRALGFIFLDSNGKEIGHGGEALNNLREIVPSSAQEKLNQIRFVIATDVTNPLIGINGATSVFSQQKGADDSMQEILEKGMINYSKICKEFIGIDYTEYPGSGAAGGVGFALKSFLGASLKPGWEIMANLTGLEEKIIGSDLVITGEGSLDSQSLGGKLISGIIELTKKHNKPLWIFCGQNSLNTEALNNRVKVFPISVEEPVVELSILNAKPLLEKLSAQAATFFILNESNLQTT